MYHKVQVQVVACCLLDAKPLPEPMLPTGPSGTTFGEIWFKIYKFPLMKMHLKMLSVKWQPYCPGRDELTLVCLHDPGLYSGVCFQTMYPTGVFGERRVYQPLILSSNRRAVCIHVKYSIICFRDIFVNEDLCEWPPFMSEKLFCSD